MNQAFKRTLTYSATAHGALVMVLVSGIIRPAPIRLGPIYGVDFLGTPGGSGGSRTIEKVEKTPPASEKVKTGATESASQGKSGELEWGLKKKRQIKRKTAALKKEAPIRRPSHSTKSAETRPTETQGEGIGVGLGPGMGAGLGKGTGGGFPYHWYLASLSSKLWQEWSRWAGSSQPHNCVVTFSIERDGSASNVTLKTSSGDPFYDKRALQSVQYAAPFPPLPAGFARGSLDLYVEFKFLAGG